MESTGNNHDNLNNNNSNSNCNDNGSGGGGNVYRDLSVSKQSLHATPEAVICDALRSAAGSGLTAELRSIYVYVLVRKGCFVNGE